MAQIFYKDGAPFMAAEYWDTPKRVYCRLAFSGYGDVITKFVKKGGCSNNLGELYKEAFNLCFLDLGGMFKREDFDQYIYFHLR